MMNKLIFGAIGMLLAVASVGCSSPCDDLVCDNCDAGDLGSDDANAQADAALKSTCQGIVDVDDGDACQLALDTGTYDTCQ